MKLYHYTSLSAAVEILKGQTLHLTDTAFMRDPSEFEYGRKLAHAMLKKGEFDNHEFTDFKYLIERDQVFSGEVYSDKYVGAYFAPQDDTSRRRYFAFSCCAKKDLLSMWRAYNGGICLEIEADSNDMNKFKSNSDWRINYSNIVRTPNNVNENIEDTNLFMNRIVYDESQQKEKILSFASALAFDKYDDTGDYPHSGLKQFYELCLAMKDPSFAEECEVRVIFATAHYHAGGPGVETINPKTPVNNFRLPLKASDDCAYPYFPLPIACIGRITGLIIGPTPMQRNNYLALRYSAIADGIKIGCSTIPSL